MPTLFLLCGLPGSGKTTLAKQLERDRHALRLTPDDWLRSLFGNDRARADAHRSAVEALQWSTAAQALERKIDVALDWGFWSRAERDDYRARAQALGARAAVKFLDVTAADLSARRADRERDAGPGAFRYSADELASWIKAFEPPTPDELR